MKRHGPEEPPQPAEMPKREGNPGRDFLYGTLLSESLLDKILNGGTGESTIQRARQIAGAAYEGSYAVPGARRVVGKLGTAYNQAWINWHERREVNAIGKWGRHNRRTEANDGTRKTLLPLLKDESIALGTRKEIELRLSRLGAKDAEIDNKKDKAQTKAEKRENKARIYANRRDDIADRLIAQYDKKLAPRERQLEEEKYEFARFKLREAAQEVYIKKDLEKARLKEEELKRMNIALRAAGRPEREIRANGTELEKVIESLRQGVAERRRVLAKERSRLEARIAKYDAKAAPYRDKRDRFIRIKERRPIETGIPARAAKESLSERETIGAHERTPAAEATASTAGEASEAGRAPQENSPAAPEGGKRHLSLETYGARWEQFLRNAYGDKEFDRMKRSGDVSSTDFDDLAKEAGLPSDEILEPEQFKNLFGLYRNLKKPGTNDGFHRIDEFMKRIILLSK